MFHDLQVESYKRITAPATLKERTLAACETTQPHKQRPFSKVLYGLVPVAACFLLWLWVIPRNHTGDGLLLQTGDLALSTQSNMLPHAASPASMCRTVSPQAPQYTITLTGNQTVEILSVDGYAALAENGDIVWTVDIPSTDTTFALCLLANDETYYVSLTYDVQDGCFSIRYETK